MVGLEVEIVSRLTPTNWCSECEDSRVEGEPEVDEHAEQRVALDDQVLKEGKEPLRLILTSERSPRSQVTGWRRTSRRAACACDCRPRRSVGTSSSLGKRAPLIHAHTCRNETDWEGLRIGGSSLRSPDDLGDREGMSTGEEGFAGTEYAKEHGLFGGECERSSENDLWDRMLRAPGLERCTRERCCSFSSRSTVSRLCDSVRARAAACLRCWTNRHC